MGRMSRAKRFTCTDANTWYKVFDENDYKNNRVKCVTLKFSEDSTADHFRYNFDGSTTNYMTTTSGVVLEKNVKALYVYVPTTAAQVIEIEVIYF